jgi:lipopolysaccharide heptosyltransferase II
MNILIRLPNWLGDMVMSIYFVREVQRQYPNAEVSVIAKKGLDGLLEHFPPLKHQFIFTKEDYKGITGLYRFGRKIRSTEQFDLFFCLPDSFSSAFMGWATGAKQKMGYKKEGRNFLLTHSYERDNRPHRIIQYLQLLENFTGKQADYSPALQLNTITSERNGIIINIHSEAQSRRIPKEKAITLIDLLCSKTNEAITLIGGPKDVAYTNEVVAGLQKSHRINNVAGTTSLSALVDLFGRSKTILSSDSGPAHLANAAGLPVVVLFGAGNENETGPYYEAPSQVIRLGKLSCEPCRRNECKFGVEPPCLTDLSNETIINTVLKLAGDDQG